VWASFLRYSIKSVSERCLKGFLMRSHDPTVLPSDIDWKRLNRIWPEGESWIVVMRGFGADVRLWVVFREVRKGGVIRVSGRWVETSNAQAGRVEFVTDDGQKWVKTVTEDWEEGWKPFYRV
jgi:hypothetical protein